MKLPFTKHGVQVLDETIKANNKAYYALKQAYKKNEEFKKKRKLTDKQKASKCWSQCKGDCAPFRYGRISDKLCTLCPGTPPI